MRINLHTRLQTTSYNILITLVALGGVLLVLYSTVWGAGLISDSFQYIAAARNFASGQILGYPTEDGQIVPLSQYPPAFPILLALFERVGLQSLALVRYLNAILFGINILLVAASILIITHSYSFALLGGFLTALASPLIETHSWALSEPLYFTFSLSTFLVLASFLQNQNMTSARSTGWLVLASLLASLSILTRYVGLSLIFAGIFCLILLSVKPWRERITHIGIFITIALLPLLLWTVNNYLVSGKINNRLPGWVPLTPKNLLSAINTVQSWFIPGPLVKDHEKLLLASGGILIAGIFLTYWLYFKRKSYGEALLPVSGQRHSLYQIHTIYLLAYPGMVVLSKMVFDNNIGFSDRMLSPMLVSLLVLLPTYLHGVWSSNKKILQWGVVFIALGLTVYYSAGAAITTKRLHNQGLGVARKSWHNSDSIKKLSSLTNVVMYSNSPSTLYLWTGSPGYTIQDFEMLRNQKSELQSILVLFNHVPINLRMQRLSEDLIILVSDRVATIYQYPP